MGYLAGGPSVSASRYPVDGAATAGQTIIPVPGGFVPGFVDVFVGGARLSPGDYTDTSGTQIVLAKPMAAGTQFNVTCWNPTTVIRPTNVVRTPVEGDATASQTVIPVPGGFLAGLTDVYVGGTLLQRSDYSDADGQTIVLAKPLAAGTSYKVYAWNPGVTTQPMGGQLAGFRNKIINGNFNIWQRGTSVPPAAQGVYLADRWKCSAVGSTIAMSRQAFALGQGVVPGEPCYFHRCVVASVAGASNYVSWFQPVEGVRTLAGQTAVLSFWAKADAPKNIAIEFAQVFGSGGSPSPQVSAIGVTTCALTANWLQFKVPVAIPSIANKTIGNNLDDLLNVNFWFDAGSNLNSRTNNLGQQSGTFDIAQVQLEPGNVATQFEDRPIGTELALCQRYYEVINEVGAFGCNGSNLIGGVAHYSVQKRATATITFSNVQATQPYGIAVTPAAQASYPDGCIISAAGTGLTAGSCYTVAMTVMANAEY